MNQPNTICSHCNAAIYVTAYEMLANKKHFCNNTCRTSAKIIYTADALEYVRENIDFISVPAMAKHLKVKVGGLKSKIAEWRKDESLPAAKEKTTIRERLAIIADSDFFNWAFYSDGVIAPDTIKIV